VVSSKHVAIVGGGAVGLSCAHYLLERGHRVTVIERGDADHDCCSLGNAGYISPSHFLPLAAPGVMGQAVRWMWNPESPFYVPPRLDPGLLSFGWRFWRASSAKRAHAAGPLLRDLNLASRALFVELAGRTRNEFELVHGGLLTLFQTERAWGQEARHAERARGLGMPAEVLDPAGVAALEPDLTLNAVGGVYYRLDSHLTPERFHAALSRLVREGGGAFEWGAEVRDWKRNGGAVRAAVTSRGEIEADEFVVAAGSWSSRLVRSLGIRLPLQPGKGYSLTLEAPPERPRRAVLLQESRVAITPMGRALRVGGTLELGAFDGDINPPRVRGILRSLSRHLPAFHSETFAACRAWCGHRPCSPDGLPYVGRFERFENLSVATGHAMMGLSMAPITGKLTAEVLSGEPPSIGISALRPDRYR
jgi:D-amino-acid dehydrogenase